MNPENLCEFCGRWFTMCQSPTGACRTARIGILEDQLKSLDAQLMAPMDEEKLALAKMCKRRIELLLRLAKDLRQRQVAAPRMAGPYNLSLFDSWDQWPSEVHCADASEPPIVTDPEAIASIKKHTVSVRLADYNVEIESALAVGAVFDYMLSARQ